VEIVTVNFLREQFVKELEHKGGETFQYFFGTEKSLKYLKKL
jgi:hypothetical protein